MKHGPNHHVLERRYVLSAVEVVNLLQGYGSAGFGAGKLSGRPRGGFFRVFAFGSGRVPQIFPVLRGFQGV